MAFTMGDIKVAAAVFQIGDSKDNIYVVGRDDMDSIDFHKRYGWGTAKRVTGWNMDEAHERFWACCVEDCFDPNIHVIRAASLGDAHDVFVNDTGAVTTDPVILGISKKEMDDFNHGKDLPGYDMNDNGELYSSEGIQIREVKLVRLEIDS